MEKIKIEKYLLDKGIPAHLKGFEYMATAIQLCQEDKSYVYNVTKKLYPKIASMYNDTYSRTERAIRTTLTYLDRDYTNASFIARALIELRELYPQKKRGGKNV